jgi:hypothetical protein
LFIVLPAFHSQELQNDKEVVLAAVQENGFSLGYASRELKSDKEVCLAAVQQTGWALEYASEELRSDKEVALAAVKQDGWALFYTCYGFKNDKEVCLAAFLQKEKAYKYINENTKIWLIRDRLTAAKLSLLHARVGAEYGLPDEMVEEVCKCICPISRVKGSFTWKFDTKNINLGMLF